MTFNIEEQDEGTNDSDARFVAGVSR